MWNNFAYEEEHIKEVKKLTPKEIKQEAVTIVHRLLAHIDKMQQEKLIFHPKMGSTIEMGARDAINISKLTSQKVYLMFNDKIILIRKDKTIREVMEEYFTEKMEI